MSASDTPGALPAANAAGAPDSLADTLLQTMPWGVLALAPDGTVAILNPRAEAMWGVPAAAVLGHTPAQVLPAVLPPELVQALAEAAPLAGPYWLPHTRQWVTLRTAPAAEGRRWVYWDDVTASQEASLAALREAEESYRTLFNSIDEGYFLCEVLFDAQAVPVDIQYLDANPAATQLVGTDYRGKRLHEIGPDYESYWFEIFGRVALTGVGERLERYAEPDQKWYDFYVSKVGDEASRRVAVVFQDITERRRQEQALQASEAQNAADLTGMRRLYELQAKLANQTDVRAALRDVLAVACEFTYTDRGCVQLLSPDGERLEMAVWQGYPDDSPFISFFRYEGLETGCEATRGQRQRLIIEETVGFEGLAGTEAGAATYAADIRAAQSTPMTSRSGETIGVISTQFRQPHRPSDHELRLLDMLAWVAAEFLERHRAEVARRAADERYRQLFNSIDEGFAVIEMIFDQRERVVDCRFLETNPAYSEQTGLKNVVGKTVREVVPNLEEFWFELYERVALTGESVRFEYEVSALGHYYNVFASRLAGAESHKIAIVFENITARRHTEKALRQSEARQTYLLQLSDALRPLAEPERIQREASRVLRAQLGASQVMYTETTGPDETLTVATDAAPNIPSQLGLRYHFNDFGPAIRAELEAGRPTWRDDVTTLPDSTATEKATYAALRIGAWASVPLVKGGRLVALLTVHFPVAHPWSADELALLQETAERTWAAVERGKAETSLRDSEALLQKSFAIDTVGLLFFSLDEHISTVNQAFERMSGYGRAELLATPTEVLTAPEFRDVTARAMQELADRGETAPYEKQLVRPDGSRWWGLSAPTRLRGHGPASDCMEFIIDISERKQAEAALQALTASLEQQVAERTKELAASQELLNAIFEAVPLQLGYYEAVRDAQGQLVDLRAMTVNRAAVERMALPDNAPGQLISAHLPGLRELPAWQAITQVIATGEARRLELRHESGPAAGWFDVLYTRLGDGIILASLDITTRRQMEQEVRDSQVLLQTIFDTSLVGMAVQEAVRDEQGDIQDFRLLLVNQELQRETGRTDLVGKHYAQEYPGIKANGLFELMRATVETGEPQHLEYYYPYEGFQRWFFSMFVKLNDGVMSTNLDITARKLAEEKVQEQAYFIARVNETIPDLISVMETPSGRLLYLNRAPFDAPGFERETLEQLSMPDRMALLRMHPDDAARLPKHLAQTAALPDHEMISYSYRLRFDTDHWHWFQVRAGVFQRDPATGTATQVMSVAQDVTAQKEAEQQQAKSYQLLRQFEEVASLGSWDYDRTTGEFQWSAGMFELFGLAPGSLIRPATYLDAAVPEDRPVAERIVRGLTQDRTGFEETLRIQANGGVKTLRVKATVVQNEAGEPVRVLGVDFDISEMQRLETENLQMRLTQQQALFGAVLEAQETERRRMAESLHNGLGQTLYAAKLQLNQLPASSSPTALTRANQLLTDAIRQTRTLSHELVPVVLTQFGLAAALHDICRTLRTPQLRFECHVDLDEQPLSQPLQVAIYRTAQELAQNVVKHAQATEASLEVEVVPGFVLLRVEDNGVGFAPVPSVQPGIGLRTIRDQMALLNGTVDVGSSPEFGTYVRLRLPLPIIAPPLL